ncbi:hypothetical protein BaRGS_00004851 [Batillaria attramentaria]|uniref:Secreted protein n=1 Tax=Batillaria attramentaria TaxID=370345 RepID=A0ABD0LX90_9CAEN
MRRACGSMLKMALLAAWGRRVVGRAMAGYRPPVKCDLRIRVVCFVIKPHWLAKLTGTITDMSLSRSGHSHASLTCSAVETRII